MHIDKLIQNIEKTVNDVLPKGAHRIVEKMKILGEYSIGITFAASDDLIHRVPGQFPQKVSLLIPYWGELKVINQFIYVKPDPGKNLAMQSVKIPFRKPKEGDGEAILRAIKRFAERWVQALKDNRDKLMYSDLVDYEKLLG